MRQIKMVKIFHQFRIYDKSESKTKNDYFMDMLSEVLSWGAKIQFITGDSWYSSTANLKP